MAREGWRRSAAHADEGPEFAVRPPSLDGKSPVACQRRGEVERIVSCAKSRYGRRGWEAGGNALSATRALACALAALGLEVPAWEDPPCAPRLAPVVREFVEHRLRYRGVAPSTVPGEVACATSFTDVTTERSLRRPRFPDDWELGGVAEGLNGPPAQERPRELLDPGLERRRHTTVVLDAVRDERAVVECPRAHR
jgi:hypothetical protein